MTQAQGYQRDYDFELYKIIVNQINHDHQRTQDNYRVFLTVNTILIVAFGYVLSSLLERGSDASLYIPFVFIFIGIGSYCGIRISKYTRLLLDRIGLDAQLKYFLLRELEGKMIDEMQQFSPQKEKTPITLFLTGYNFFFNDHKAPEPKYHKPQKDGILEVPCPAFLEGSRFKKVIHVVTDSFTVIYWLILVCSIVYFVFSTYSLTGSILLFRCGDMWTRWLQVAGVTSIGVGTWFLAFGLKIRGGIDVDLEKELGLEKKGFYPPTNVRQRTVLFWSGLVLITIGVIIELWLVTFFT